MFTIPENATDDDLRDGVCQWLTLLASDALSDADAFLDKDGLANAMSVAEFLDRLAELTGGRASTASTSCVGCIRTS